MSEKEEKERKMREKERKKRETERKLREEDTKDISGGSGVALGRPKCSSSRQYDVFERSHGGHREYGTNRGTPAH